jgi:hypothetical protein
VKPFFLRTAYIALVFGLDALGRLKIPFDFFKTADGFDRSKFLFWFIIPFLFSIPEFDSRYFRFKTSTLKEKKLWILIVAMTLTSLFAWHGIPEIKHYYPSLSALSLEDKWIVFKRTFIWTVSWLLGWEFCFRYVCVRHLPTRASGRTLVLWICIPALEMGYHFLSQKPHIETLGMGVFSVLATFWVMKTKNIWLPFLAHATVELGLISVMLFG